MDSISLPAASLSARYCCCGAPIQLYSYACMFQISCRISNGGLYLLKTLPTSPKPAGIPNSEPPNSVMSLWPLDVHEYIVWQHSGRIWSYWIRTIARDKTTWLQSHPILFLDNSLPDDAHLFNTENSGKYTSTRRDTSGEYEFIVVLRQTHLRYPVVNGVPMVHGVDDLSPDRQPSCCGYILNSVEEFTSEMQMSMFLS